MINYTDKPGLSEAFRKAGIYFREENGKFTVNHPDTGKNPEKYADVNAQNEIAAQAIINNHTLLDSANHICEQIDEYATTLRNKSIKGLSTFEVARWSVKSAEAEKLAISNNVADAPSLAKEAASRGISVEELASKVLANAEATTDAEANIAGTAGKHKDAVRSLSSFDDVKEYDFSNGWPVV